MLTRGKGNHCLCLQADPCLNEVKGVVTEPCLNEVKGVGIAVFVFRAKPSLNEVKGWGLLSLSSGLSLA